MKVTTNAVMFDLDGTLINSLPGIAASLNRVLEQHDLPTHKEDVVRTFIGDGIVKLVERAIPKNVSHEELNSLVQVMKTDYAETWQDGSQPYQGVTRVLQTLLDHHLPIAVFSNKPDIYCKEITDTLFPSIPFTKVLGQRNGVPTKPNPAGAFDVAQEFNLPIETIAYLGDSTIDILTAQNSGMLAIAATWGYHDQPALEAKKPDHLIHKIDELLPIVLP